MDDSGGSRELVTSELSTEEVLCVKNCLPDGLKLFEHLRDQEMTLRLEDFPAYVRSLELTVAHAGSELALDPHDRRAAEPMDQRPP